MVTICKDYWVCIECLVNLWKIQTLVLLETYTEGYNLLGFDIDPTTSPDFRYIGMPKQGHTKLNIIFKSHLEDPVTLILYATFPETMELTKQRMSD